MPDPTAIRAGPSHARAFDAAAGGRDIGLGWAATGGGAVGGGVGCRFQFGFTTAASRAVRSSSQARRPASRVSMIRRAAGQTGLVPWSWYSTGPVGVLRTSIETAQEKRVCS